MTRSHPTVRRIWNAAALLLVSLVSIALASAAPAWATPPAVPAGRIVGPAGPTPRNPAGPTPRNPAGIPPLGAPGSFAPSGRFVQQPFFVGGDPFFQPQPFVAVVGPGVAPGFPGGSFFCRVHNRGFATQQFFFDHLALVDGVDPFLASENIFADGGVWVFTGE